MYSLLTELEIINTYGWQVEVLGFGYGIILANCDSKFREFSARNWGIKAAFLVTCSMILGVLYLKYKPVFFVGSYILKVLLGVSLVCMILHLLVRFRINNRLNAFLGRVSYEVYLVHGTAFLVVKSMYSQMNSGVFIIMSLILTVVMAWLIHFVCEKCLSLYFGAVRKLKRIYQ